MRTEIHDLWPTRRREDNSRTESGHRWVDTRFNREKRDHPYSYSEFYLWGQQGKGDHGVYSDRLNQWSSEQWDRAWAAMKTAGIEKRFDMMCAKDARLFLTAYYGWPIICTAMIEGCNVGNGYPYWVFYFKSGF